MAVYLLSHRWIKFGVLGTILVLLATVAYFSLRRPSLEIDPMVGRAIVPPMRIPQFSLIDQRGKTFDRRSLNGHWTLMIIGFTYCPDVCPTALLQLAAFYKQLGKEPGEDKVPSFVFLSVDPFRDTQEELTRYVKYFHRGFLGVTGKPQEIKELVAALGLYYAYTDQNDDHFLDSVLVKPDQDDYGVTHSSRLLIISPQAKLVAIMTPPFLLDNIGMFLERLRKYYGE